MRTRWLALALLPISAAGCGADPRPSVSLLASADVPPASERQPTVVPSAPASGMPSAAASQAAASPSPASPVSTADALERYVAESSAAWASRELGKHTKLYASEAAITMGGLQEEDVTPSELEARLARDLAATPDLQLRFARGLAGDGVAVTEWLLSGSFEPQDATKTKPFGCRGASVLSFAADGQVTRELRFCDFGILAPLPAGAEPLAGAAPELLFATDKDSDGVARAWLRAADDGDAKTLLALASEDYVWSGTGEGKGRKALASGAQSLSKTFTNVTSTVSMCIPTTRAIACLFDWRATWSGPLSGLKANGRTGVVRTLQVLTLSNGRVSRSNRYFDANQFFKAFGISDDPLFWLKMKGDGRGAIPH